MIKRKATLLSIIPTLIGIAGIIGWVAHINVLTNIGKHFIPIAPSTAILFIILSIMLILYNNFISSRSAIVLYKIISITTLIFLCIILFEFFTGIKIGIENILIRNTQQLDLVPTGRMSRYLSIVMRHFFSLFNSRFKLRIDHPELGIDRRLVC